MVLRRWVALLGVVCGVLWLALSAHEPTGFCPGTPAAFGADQGEPAPAVVDADQGVAGVVLPNGGSPQPVVGVLPVRGPRRGALSRPLAMTCDAHPPGHERRRSSPKLVRGPPRAA